MHFPHFTLEMGREFASAIKKRELPKKGCHGKWKATLNMQVCNPPPPWFHAYFHITEREIYIYQRDLKCEIQSGGQRLYCHLFHVVYGKYYCFISLLMFSIWIWFYMSCQHIHVCFQFVDWLKDKLKGPKTLGCTKELEFHFISLLSYYVRFNFANKNKQVYGVKNLCAHYIINMISQDPWLHL